MSTMTAVMRGYLIEKKEREKKKKNGEVSEPKCVKPKKVCG